MKKFSVWLCVLLTLGVTVGMMRNYARSARRVAPADTGAAFRDGWYLGKRAAKRGENPHVASGRWSSNEDRASFVAGYHEAYTEALSRTTSSSQVLAPI